MPIAQVSCAVVQGRWDGFSASGVVVSPDGYVLTVDHWIGFDVHSVEVRFRGSEWRRAAVVYRDHKRDIAILKIPVREELPYVKLFRSGRVGELVRVLGMDAESGKVEAGFESGYRNNRNNRNHKTNDN